MFRILAIVKLVKSENVSNYSSRLDPEQHILESQLNSDNK